ncbi:hypothetical protein ACGFNP_00045 [Nonomuraea sp. NPDC049269]|uniref:hypothetical protein n=1 Tax=Nonomuraea sp. NPDC049269 TaxID=3364349 RepID=UPI0037135147
MVRLDTAAGLSNATIQQRVVVVRPFYEFLVEDGLRERNPVRRGHSSRHDGRARQGLVRRIEQAPWITSEAAWRSILIAATAQPLRNRLMVALAYDGALRREELIQLELGDFEPAVRPRRSRSPSARTPGRSPRCVPSGQTILAGTVVLPSPYFANHRCCPGPYGAPGEHPRAG